MLIWSVCNKPGWNTFDRPPFQIGDNRAAYRLQGVSQHSGQTGIQML